MTGSPDTTQYDQLTALLSRRLVFQIGKGGVGRSTMTAALARLAASHGKRVLVCEVNTKERMSSLLGGTPPASFTELDQVWQPQERIWAVNIRPWPGMKEYVSEVLRMRLVFNLIFENNVMRYFLRAVPGLQELIFVGKAWFHVTEALPDGRPRFDMVIVDAPATGHGLAMLRVPEVILEVIPPGPMRTATERIHALINDPEQTCINLVSLPEEMPVNETIELETKLRDMLDLPIGVTWMNQWPAPVGTDSTRARLETHLEAGLQDEQAWPYFAAAQVRLHSQRKAERYLQHYQSKFATPVLKVPYVQHGSDEEALASALADQLDQMMATEDGAVTDATNPG